jgi:hypothetical protein
VPQEILCSSVDFVSLPTQQRDLQIRELVSVHWTQAQDDYEYQPISDRLRTYLNSTVVGYQGGQLLLKGQHISLLSKTRVVAVLDLGADMKVLLQENLVVNIAGSERKLSLSALESLQVLYFGQKPKKEELNFDEEKQAVKVPSPFTDAPDALIQTCTVIGNLMFLALVNRKEVAVLTWPKMEEMGYLLPYPTANTVRVLSWKQDLIALSKENMLTLWKIDQSLDRPVAHHPTL